MTSKSFSRLPYLSFLSALSLHSLASLDMAVANFTFFDNLLATYVQGTEVELWSAICTLLT